MLVSELRTLLNKHTKEDLILCIVEMYKSMPKKMREEKDIDSLLQNVDAHLRIKKNKTVQQNQVDVNELKPEIEQFIDYAYKQYYFAPNSYIHKKDRPKWRFIVRQYIKDLLGVTTENADGKIASDLLVKLYSMLSYACCYYIFSTDNPFRSVGMEQTDLLNQIIERILSSGINRNSVKSAIELVVNNEPDRDTLHSSCIMVLVENLKTPDSKELAIEQCIALKAEVDKPIQKPSKSSWDSSSRNYERNKKVNLLVETVFRLNMELGEYDSGIRFFKSNYNERSNEISLYVLLRLLFSYDQKELLLREYDDAVKNKVQPRTQLQKLYQYIRKNDTLPEYFYVE